jgi:hypothetical protein
VNVRPPAVAGQFYPGTRGSLLAVLDRCMSARVEPAKVLGLVVPHAGYLYSGATAGATYARAVIPDRVAVLSPNHTGIGRPMAVWAKGSWETPLGAADVDEELAGALLRRCPDAAADQMAHLREHSLEVQLPFIQRRNPAAKILPITLGTHEEHRLRALGEALAEVISQAGRPALVVASSDMTHYESAAAARQKDELALARILALDPSGLLGTVRKHGITMCGAAPVAAMLWAAKALGARKCELVEYTHSGAVTGDDSQVVGYAGLIVT